ncbi:MAG: hypothetical protein U0903_10875 [Planctomycetales bacterium]
MRRPLMLLSFLAVFALGYALGTSGWFPASTAWAQQQQDDAEKEKKKEEAALLAGISAETQAKIKAAYEALTVAADALKGDNRYATATNGVNAFAVLSGGLNALQDLDAGGGVDPETFAAIYAGNASDEVKGKLQRDSATNKYTYNGKLIQLYPVSQLKRMYLMRQRLSGMAAPAEKEEKTEK